MRAYNSHCHWNFDEPSRRHRNLIIFEIRMALLPKDKIHRALSKAKTTVSFHCQHPKA